MLFKQGKQTTLKINGGNYTIPTDFRICLNLLLSILNEDETAVFKYLQEYKLPLENIEESLNELSKFLSGGAKAPLDASKTDSSFFKIFDFVQDEYLICASFLMDYKIDLNTVELSWSQFMHLLINLSEETPLKKAIHFRAVDISKVPKEQKEFYKQMKKHFELKTPNKENKPSITAEDRHNEWKKAVQDAFDKAERKLNQNRKE